MTFPSFLVSLSTFCFLQKNLLFFGVVFLFEMPNSAELSQKKDMSKFTKRKRFVDAKPPRDEGLQLETHVDSFTPPSRL